MATEIQLLECITGPLGTYMPGDIWAHPDDDDAARIVAAGIAIRVDKSSDPALRPVETPEAKQAAKRSKR